MIAAPPGHLVNVSYRDEKRDSTLAVVAYDDDGYPLVIDPGGYCGVGLIHPGDVRGVGQWSLCEDAVLLPPVAAEPGWVAVTVGHGDDESIVERLPVVAWRGSADHYGGSAIVIASDDCGTTLPLDVVDYARETVSVDLVGCFHPERLPARDDLIRVEVERLRVAYLERADARRRQAA
jgi:hypothetical protein